MFFVSSSRKISHFSFSRLLPPRKYPHLQVYCVLGLYTQSEAPSNTANSCAPPLVPCVHTLVNTIRTAGDRAHVAFCPSLTNSSGTKEKNSDLTSSCLRVLCSPPSSAPCAFVLFAITLTLDECCALAISDLPAAMSPLPVNSSFFFHCMWAGSSLRKITNAASPFSFQHLLSSHNTATSPNTKQNGFQARSRMDLRVSASRVISSLSVRI